MNMLNTEKIKKDFITHLKGKKVCLNFLKNNTGTIVGICNYGARITHFCIEKENKFFDIVLGCDNIDDYISENEKYLGVTVGRFANRIANGKFTLNNQEIVITEGKASFIFENPIQIKDMRKTIARLETELTLKQQ